MNISILPVSADQYAQISNVLGRYAWTYDMDRLDLLGECFARDAIVEFGDTGFKSGREAVVAELSRRREKYRPSGDIPWHVITNIFVQPEMEKSARVQSWYSFGTMTRGSPMTLDKFGRYEDVFMLEDGVWRIARRRVLDLNAPDSLKTELS